MFEILFRWWYLKIILVSWVVPLKKSSGLMVILYEISETRQRLVSYISYEMTTHVRSSLYADISSTVSP